ncbi:aminodeoxychorismate synthase component I [Mangrovibacterium lignilyticum]|uniref:aminodeoxychorismate synthase component I n=1 Tax=Mangrovibacterium lignilyticum TaxID=2668052 RepID=UPI0019678B85|nr:aminodeoxychorismate synthase component I [Mangrovibacterium lignilyticum]
MNELGKRKQPFVFLFDFECQRAKVLEWDECAPKLLWRTPQHANFSREKLPHHPVSWHVEPVKHERYQQAFELVQQHIHGGDSYLLNLTMPSRVDTNLTLEEIAHKSNSPYLVYLKDEFVCFSPEIFVRIENGRISSYPMKGTIDASLPNAETLLKTNRKERAEHHTIVDLIRNDLSRVAEQVEVKRFCYMDEINSNRGKLLQMSSEITGKLPADYNDHLGDLFAGLLPAGSISGAPKKKTVEIIEAAEQYERGWYTGIFGVFDGENVDSCVLIRYLEQNGGHFTFKSGGGITHLSQCEEEYEELINKVYVPIT